MADEIPASVPKITITAGRLDATVILGATRYGVTLDPRAPDSEPVQMAVVALRDALIEVAKNDLATSLDDYISKSTKRALTS